MSSNRRAVPLLDRQIRQGQIARHSQSRVLPQPSLDQTLTLGTAVVTVTPVALTTTQGGVSLALGTATITVTPVQLDISVPAGFAPVITRPRIAWSSAGVTSTRGRPPRLIGRSRFLLPSSPQTIALGTAVITVTPVALGTTLGNPNVALTPATITVTPVALALVQGDPLVVTRPRVAWSSAGNRSVRPRPPVFRARSRGIQFLSFPQSLTLTAATVTVTPVALGITNVGGSDQTIPLTAATITVAPVALAVTTGGTSLTLTAATVTVTAVALSSTQGGASVALSPATVTITAVTLTVSPAVSVALSPSSITVTAVALGISTSAFVPDTDPITLTLKGRGHTATLRGKGTLTLRSRGHTATARLDQEATLRGRGHNLTIREHV